VVLLCGCDKTTPGQLMGAASADLPAIQVCVGPKTPGYWRGQEVGSGTDLWKYLDQYRMGEISAADWRALEEVYSCSTGTCNTIGTASTMTMLSEVLGMMLPGTATIPANDSRRLAAAERSGRRAVALVEAGVRPSSILTRQAFENALRVFTAMGGSTNAVIHLLAIAGRLRVPLALEDFDRIARETPVLLNLRPTGDLLVNALDAIGGVPALLAELQDLLHLESTTVSGQSLGAHIPAPGADTNVVRTRNNPLYAAGGLVVVRGNLVPNGAILRTTTASPQLLTHRGPAIVFDDYADMLARIDIPDLPVTPESVLILRNAGAVGVPGMPEWGAIPIPKKLLMRGVRDMLRITDARMSGTSSGTIVLHAAPEAAIGGPLALVHDGDIIELDVAARTLTLAVSEAELSQRRAAWQRPAFKHTRGFPRLYAEHVLQPHEGCDFDFLRPQSDADLGLIAPVVGRS
jgi:dihydroxy-acid dehydratase